MFNELEMEQAKQNRNTSLSYHEVLREEATRAFASVNSCSEGKLRPRYPGGGKWKGKRRLSMILLQLPMHISRPEVVVSPSACILTDVTVLATAVQVNSTTSRCDIHTHRTYTQQHSPLDFQ